METGTLQWLQQAGDIEHNDYERLIARCLNGDEVAYGALYRACAAMIYRLNYSLLGNVEDAEEVLQDSFEYAFRRLHTLSLIHI